MAMIVLGMHRSGTSAITGLIAGMGAYIGPEDMLLPASPDNLKGFFERNDVMAINRAILKSQNCNWYQLGRFDPNLPLPPQLAEPMKAIAAELAAHTPYALKDPRLCLTLPYWLPFFSKKPVAVLAVRNPAAIAQSLQSRNGMGYAHALALWELHMVHALNVINEQGLGVVRANYDLLMTQTERTIKSLYSVLSAYYPSLRLPDPAIMDKSLAHAEGKSGQLTPHQRDLHRIVTGEKPWKELLTVSNEATELLKSMPVLPPQC